MTRKARQAGKVLVVEDDFDIRGLILMRLEESGIPVVGFADDAEAAITLARETRPAVVVLDLALRTTSGLDVLPEALALGCHVTVYTAFNWPDAQAALDQGAHAAFLKMELNEMIDHVIEVASKS